MRPGLLLVLFALQAATASAQSIGPTQRTPDRRPDLEGVWATRFVTRLERAPEASAVDVSPDQAWRIADAIVARDQAKPVTDPDAKQFGYDQLARVNGVFRAALIVEPADGKLPYSKGGLETAERSNALESYGFDNPEERPDSERCISGQGAPIFVPNQIVQTPGAVVIWTEDVQGARIIRMSGPTTPAAIQPRDGSSYGRWQGDTLVVETTGFRKDDRVRSQLGRPIALSSDCKAIERFTRISKRDFALSVFSRRCGALYEALAG